jgi:hypothetical protein
LKLQNLLLHLKHHPGVLRSVRTYSHSSLKKDSLIDKPVFPPSVPLLPPLSLTSNDFS